MAETRFVQTLYARSDDPTDLFRHFSGWYGPEYHLMSWSLSCLCLREYYDNVHLYCNSPAARILIDELQLPYTEVHVTHDKPAFVMPHPDVWAFPKIHTYSLQESPFLHLDGDVFIFREFAPEFLRRPLVAQEPEESNGYYNEMQLQLMNSFDYLPGCVREAFFGGEPVHSLCAGILGGTNLEFFREYTSAAKEYVYRNLGNLHRVDVSKFNIFFEQHLCCTLAAKMQVPISFLIPKAAGDYLFDGLANFWEVPMKRTFLHLLGDFKRKVIYTSQLAQMLKRHYPEQYFKVIGLFRKKNQKLKVDYYYQVDDKSSAGLAEYFAGAREAFSMNRSAAAETVEVVFEDRLLGEEVIFLKGIIDDVDFCAVSFTRGELEADLAQFIENLKSVIRRAECLSKAFLYGRDMDAFATYQSVYAVHELLLTKKVIVGQGVETLTADYNWGFYLRLYRQSGFVPLIRSAQISEGEYFAIVIPEAYRFGYLIFDVELLSIAILQLLSDPITIGELLIRTRDYLDPQFSIESREETDRVILDLLEALIRWKAVRFIS
jgi:hypothetical protein